MRDVRDVNLNVEFLGVKSPLPFYASSTARVGLAAELVSGLAFETGGTLIHREKSL